MSPDISRLFQEIRIVWKLLPLSAFLTWLLNASRCAPTLWRTRSLGPLDQRLGASFDIVWQQQRLHFEQLDFGVAREIFGHLCYAPPEALKNANHILDLGANSGAFTVFAALAAPEAHIQAVEAQAELVQALQYNVACNRCENRVKTQCAVVGGGYNEWTQTLLRNHPSVAIFDINQYIDQVGQCDFLKCDVEGGEFPLFRGDLHWTRAVKHIALEYHPQEGNVEQLEQTLRDQGFCVHRVDHSTLGYLYCRKKTHKN